MKNIPSKKLIPWICGLLLAAVIAGAGCLLINCGGPEKEGHHVVIFGDSIIAYKQDETSVANMIIARTGMDVFDLSFGGTQMADSTEVDTLGNKRAYMSMYSIAQALYTDDFSLQLNYRTYDPATEYFDERIKQLRTLDLAQTDIVIIEHCINDYHCAIPIGDVDSDSEYTYCGALRMSVDHIRRINPDIRIILVSPTEKWMPDGVNASDYSYGGGILDEYVEAQRMMAEELGVEYISMYELYEREVSSFGDEVTEEAVTGFKYTVDGTHPNYYGRYVISDLLADYLGGAITCDDSE